MNISFKKICAACFAGLAIGLAVSSVQLRSALAATSFFTFGGDIQDTLVCDCTGNFWLQVGPPVSARLIYQPGNSILHSYGQVFRRGPNVLGLYRPGGTCNFNPPDCPQRDADGTIYRVGTSK